MENDYYQEILEIKLPRWNELPEIDLYMEQVIQLVDRATSPFKVNDSKNKLITSSMVHNYVKHDYILSPVKKKYDRRHLARLIIITILKQSFELPTIHQGILKQIDQGDYRLAYDHFCEQLEDTIRTLVISLNDGNITINRTDDKYLTVQMATITLASKLITEKTLK
ncbi:DUF1836 domain-containing protein [Vagococcus xieshaowenii]|uniref:DUF1836 domain-containing protein n=1 Tax=Vagococcus xieshaowenii TaxID=2562451 RepID=A0AAJ5JLN6_9ENTE|nr:DUF1836 domain-containing protein [Vagococcus xieshaowenii]QCA28580.1 DUF1836 domain-containing protein [Vagococcus xieshaowenii]TFZ40612.1 DUF1836 domain-containing protein [Vagococcus xieshaowenii]